jgi:hypothetical protein
VSDDQSTGPDTGDPTAAFLAALRVRRNAVVGFGAGGALAIVIFLLFVGLQPATIQARPLYLVLAIVVALAGGALFAVGLTIVTAVRRVRAMDERE